MLVIAGAVEVVGVEPSGFVDALVSASGMVDDGSTTAEGEDGFGGEGGVGSSVLVSVKAEVKPRNRMSLMPLRLDHSANREIDTAS